MCNAPWPGGGGAADTRDAAAVAAISCGTLASAESGAAAGHSADEHISGTFHLQVAAWGGKLIESACVCDCDFQSISIILSINVMIHSPFFDLIHPYTNIGCKKNIAANDYSSIITST